MKQIIVCLIVLITVDIFSQSVEPSFTIEINSLKLPISNDGTIAFNQIADSTEVFGATFDNNIILSSGGFALSGLFNGKVWSSSVIPDQRVIDYLPGKIGAESTDSTNKIFILKSTDLPFGQSWIEWAKATSQGADFYDGNKDGIYNPVDLNENGKWDMDEDSPDLIGDITTWSVFNDGVPSSKRKLPEEPSKIEIKQTVFAYLKDSYEELDGVIFMRYQIENKSEAIYDSVFFSIANNPCIGNGKNDLVGCDTNLNATYGYDKSEDEVYGNSPSIFALLLQGAPIYIPGKTFIDNNENNIYDSGIDLPVDTATFKNGESIGQSFFPGAKNQNMTSTYSYYSGNIGPFYPNTSTELRNNQKGLSRIGENIDVCNGPFPSVIGEDCATISPYYVFSGDPTIPKGWIQENQGDQSSLNSSGPFTLNPYEPIDIIVAYIAGRGNTSIESVKITKGIAENTIGFYNTNFSYIPVGVKYYKNQLPNSFELSQNYPNPFNPSTKIQFSVPEQSHVTLNVFNILGQKVATLVNGIKTSGNYEVSFDAAKLSTGVYIYRLEAGNNTITKKMTLLK